MSFDLTVLGMAKSLAAHAGKRQALISENIANADTREYVARDLKPFEAVYREPGASKANAGPRATRPGHIGYQDTQGANARAIDIAKLGSHSPNGNTVSLEDQMTRGADAQLRHELALSVFRKSMDMLRMAVSRGR